MSESVTIVGAGAGACAAAAELAVRGYDVLMFNRSQERLAPLHKVGGVRATIEGKDHGLVPVARFSTDAKEAATFSSTVLVVAPTTAFGYYAEQLGPLLGAQHHVLLVPGHTGGAMYFQREVRRAEGDAPFLLGETHTLPYVCRMTSPEEVTVWKRNRRVMAAALPATRNDELMETFSPLLRDLVLAQSVLETSLSNTNAVMHPPGVLLNVGWIESTRGGFKYYAEGHTASVGRVIDELDKERLAIGRAYGLELRRWIDVFYAAGYTTQTAWKTGLATVAINESEPNKAIDAPDSMEHRYIREDFGYGLVPMSVLAALAGVPTPVTDALITIGSTASGTDLTATGLCAERLGCTDVTMSELDAMVKG